MAEEQKMNTDFNNKTSTIPEAEKKTTQLLLDWYGFQPGEEKIDLQKVQLKDFFTDEEWEKCMWNTEKKEPMSAHQLNDIIQQLHTHQLNEIIQQLHTETGIHPVLARQILVQHHWDYINSRNEAIGIPVQVQMSILIEQFSNEIGIDPNFAFQLLEHNQWVVESALNHLVSILTQQLVSDTGIDEASASQLIVLHQFNFESSKHEALSIVSRRNALYQSIQGNKPTHYDGISNGLFGYFLVVAS